MKSFAFEEILQNGRYDSLGRIPFDQLGEDIVLVDDDVINQGLPEGLQVGKFDRRAFVGAGELGRRCREQALKDFEDLWIVEEEMNQKESISLIML